MNTALTLGSFVFFTALVAAITWWKSRGGDSGSNDGFFLAGRSLTFPFIAASLLLTNLSTEQLVGLNGQGYTTGLAVMMWEVVGVIAIVMMALFFLPKFLRSGITTVPELLDIRFGSRARLVCNVIFLLAYMFILLPMILYTGAKGMMGILDLNAATGIRSNTTLLWIMVWVIGCIGSVYAIFGGLRSIVVSDLLNGIGLLLGGFLITFFGLWACGAIDLSGEATGILHTEDTISEVDLATSSFGQGFTCTMIQEAAAMCAVINGGYYYKPHVISRVLDSTGSVKKNYGKILEKQVVSEEVSGLLRQYMVECAEEGTAQPAKVDCYSSRV